MKACHFLTAVLLIATCAQANVYEPRAKLAGETVNVRILNDSAVVTAIFEFEQWITRDEKVVYFPIFAADIDDPLRVLARAKVELEVGGKKVGTAVPCKAPRVFDKLPGGVRAYWFVANLDDLVADSEVDYAAQVVMKVTYVQALLHGRFYYLPVITGHESTGLEKRSWQYQMHARSAERMIRIRSEKSDYEQLDDALVVYLRDGEIVELE